MAYVCSATHREDLTGELRRLLGPGFEQRLKTEAVSIRCSQGHLNIFGESLEMIDLVESRNDD